MAAYSCYGLAAISDDYSFHDRRLMIDSFSAEISYLITIVYVMLSIGYEFLNPLGMRSLSTLYGKLVTSLHLAVNYSYILSQVDGRTRRRLRSASPAALVEPISTQHNHRRSLVSICGCTCMFKPRISVKMSFTIKKNRCSCNKMSVRL